jgi:hypothetical protein
MTRINPASTQPQASAGSSRSETAQRAAEVINGAIRYQDGERSPLDHIGVNRSGTSKADKRNPVSPAQESPLDHISVNRSPDTSKTAKGQDDLAGQWADAINQRP